MTAFGSTLDHLFDLAKMFDHVTLDDRTEQQLPKKLTADRPANTKPAFIGQLSAVALLLKLKTINKFP